jgi:flagellar biosynthesis chaperone FliJ
MTTAPTIPARPVAPTAPAEYVRLVKCHNDAMRAFNRAVGRSYVDVPAAQTAISCELASRSEISRWLATDAGRAFAAQMHAYNAQVDAYNTALAGERQARINRRDANRVRAAACSRCYATHPGEC